MTVTTSAPEVMVDRKVTVIGLGPPFKSVDEQVLDAGLRMRLLTAVDRADPPLVVLDLSETTFFGSSFIELLFRMWNRIQTKPSGAFAICGVTAYCREVLTVAHLDTLWRLYATRDQAVEALANGTS